MAAKHKQPQAHGHGGHGHGHGATGGGEAGAHEQHGIKRYIIVWLLLLVFTVLTVVTGKMTANIFLAMAIAITKATLVVLFFMHLWDEGGVNRMVFVVSIIFVAVLLLGTFGDLMTRNPMTLPNEGPMPYREGQFDGVPTPSPTQH